jgi:hypothetical protein
MADPATLPRGIAGTCMIETAEGPVAMSETPNKGFAVLTRMPGGGLGFRQLIKVVSAGPVPLVRIVLESGHVALTAAGHVFYKKGMQPVPASQLAPGDVLETAFQYPEGYQPPDADQVVHGDVPVRSVEPAGEGQVWSGTVRDTHALFLTAGVLCSE